MYNSVDDDNLMLIHTFNGKYLEYLACTKVKVNNVNLCAIVTMVIMLLTFIHFLI